MRLIKITILAVAACAALATAAGAQTLASHCSKSPQVSLLLVDQTDVFDAVDKARIADGISKLVGELQGGSRLDVYAITNRPGNLTPGLQICVPQCGIAGQPACDDALYLRHRQAFNGQIQQVVGGYIQNARPLDESEILRSLYWLSREYEGRNARNVYMFSDLIEFSDLNQTVSTYSRATADSLMRKVKTKLSPGRGFTQAKILVFGFGKRLGSQAKELSIQSAIERAEEMKQTTSPKPGGKSPPVPKVESFELSTESLKHIDYFWQRYFSELAGAPKTDIRQNY